MGKIFIVIHMKWIFLLILNIDRTMTNSVGTSSKRRNSVLHLGLHHFNPPSQWKYYKANASLERAEMCAPKGQRDGDSSINK